MGIERPIPPSQKNKLTHYPSKRKSYSNQDQPKKNYRKHKTHKYKPQYPSRTHKKDIKCFKCGKIGHIAPNCRKQKINVLSNKNYYSEASKDDAFSFDDYKIIQSQKMRKVQPIR